MIIYYGLKNLIMNGNVNNLIKLGRWKVNDNVIRKIDFGNIDSCYKSYNKIIEKKIIKNSINYNEKSVCSKTKPRI